VALGGSGKDYSTGEVRNFPTPSGHFYLKRINERPWWYPPAWAREKKPKAPGPNNPYGLWMAELFRTNGICGYEFSPPGDARIRMHSTNNPRSMGQYASHGCVRIHPEVAGELFPAILHYTPHREPKTNGRGTIYPFNKVIPVQIVEK
jgi:lipoprotein-anchoring transpeptidase ErfK/SrfK